MFALLLPNQQVRRYFRTENSPISKGIFIRARNSKVEIPHALSGLVFNITLNAIHRAKLGFLLIICADANIGELFSDLVRCDLIATPERRSTAFPTK